MKKISIGLLIATTAAAAFAADERAAANVVRKYSEAIACQIQEPQYQKNQYKAVKVVQGDKELGGLGDLFVVYWEGDVGCMGGNGTVVPNFTVVEQSGFSSVPPVVWADYKFPELELVQVTSISGKNGTLQIAGVTFGPNDQQGTPTKKVMYTLKFDQEKRTFVKR
jgi:hypothetical protein